MKKIVLMVIVLLPLTMSAQFLEGGLFLGGSNYMGDLPEGNIEYSETNLAGGLFIRYNINDYVSVRGGLNLGQISGSDANADNEAQRARNLSFRSNITEFSVIPEFNILGFNPYDRIWSPYVFVGLSIYNFNPQAQLDGQWYDLQPLATEGQGQPGRPSLYNLTQLAIPMGFGVKYAITEYWTVGFLASMRYTFTDYLDDISTTYADRQDIIDATGVIAANLANRQGELLGTEPINTPGTRRGSENRDWYVFSGFTISYNFLDGFGGSKYGCPTNF